MENNEVTSNMFVRDPITATMGNEILPFETSHLTKYFQKKAEVELHDTPQQRKQGLKQIKEMIKSEKCLEGLNCSDEFLLTFLRTRKFDISRAFTQLKAFIIFKKKNPDVMGNFRFESVIKTVTYKLANMLPYRCQDGCAIFLVEVENWYPELYTIEEVKQTFLVLMMQTARNIMTQVNGIKIILDFKSNLQALRYCTPRTIGLLHHGTQDCCPIRHKAVHIVNQSLTLKVVWMILKHMLSEKLRKRMYFHSSIETLLDYFPKETLPVKYGGTLENYDMTDWVRKIMQPQELAAMLGEDGITTT